MRHRAIFKHILLRSDTLGRVLKRQTKPVVRYRIDAKFQLYRVPVAGLYEVPQNFLPIDQSSRSRTRTPLSRGGEVARVRTRKNPRNSSTSRFLD